MKQETIDNYINIYIDSLTSVSNDAGWRGNSIMARWILFGGQPPKGTGMDLSNQTMIEAVKYLRKAHELAPRIHRVILHLLGDRETSHHTLALLARHYYRGMFPGEDRIWRDSDRCVRIGQSPSSFSRNLKRGYEDFERVWKSDIA